MTFSTDIAPLVRAGLVPAFVDVEPDTFNIDVDGIEAMISPRTKAILAPNLIGNAPDWDRIRAIADAHGLKVIEDSCDALGANAARHADRHPLRHQRHQLRPRAHHHRRRHRRDGAARRRRVDRPLPAAAPVGSPLGAAVLRLEEGRPPVLHRRRRHRVRQPLHLRRGRLELRAVRDQRRVRPRAAAASCPTNLARRQRNFDLLSAFFGTYPDVFTLPRQLEELETGLAHVPDPAPARVGHPPGRLPGAHGGARHRHAHGVDRQRHPPARVRQGAAPGARRAGCPTPTG